MLTPAEELGLSGLSLASRVRKAFEHIPPARLKALVLRLDEEAQRRHLCYLREGVPEIIRVMSCPLTVLPDQLVYIQYVCETINRALKRLPDLYLEDDGVREALRLPPEEEHWLRQCWGAGQRESNPIFGRLDAMVDFLSPMWKDSLRFIEPNLSGIGGLHMVPTAEGMVAEFTLPELVAQDPRLHLEIGRDVRELLIQEILDQLEALGRPGRNICFVEPKYAGTGPDEQDALARFYHDRLGLNILHADPAELTLRDGEVYYEDTRIDVIYRDYSVVELMALERKGIDVEPMRVLFRANRAISSIGAELDQKNCWEVLTDRRLTQKHFSSDERQVFRRHILWTRLVADRSTTLPDGNKGSLLDFIRRDQERLVLKPNRAYGGEGVLLGHLHTAEEWHSALERAVNDSARWVVQELASIPVSEFAVPAPDGTIHTEPFYTVMGFASTKYGLSILGRASQKQVVNVAQRGGMCVLMTGRPPSKLMGPSPVGK